MASCGLTVQGFPGETYQNAMDPGLRSLAASTAGARLVSGLRCWQHSSRGQGGDPETEALGRSQGGVSTKVQLQAEGSGKPMSFVLSPGQRHEAVVFKSLLEQGAVRRKGGGRPRTRPQRVIGDKGYSSSAIRCYLRHRGMRQTIPCKSNQRRRGRFDRGSYRQRNWIECLINQLKQFRRVATRYEKRAENYLTMLTLAAIWIWL